MISPKTSIYLNIALAVLLLVGSGVLYRPSFVSESMSKDIVGIGASAALILNVILHAWSAPQPGPAVSTSVVPRGFGFLLVAGGLLLAFHPGAAQAKARAIPTPIARPAAGFTLQTPDQLIDKIRLWATGDAGADLDAAIAVGKSANNPVTVPCFQAIRDFVTIVQGLPTADKLPKIHLAVDIEILTDLEIQLLPNSRTVTSCTALANFQVISAQNLVTGIVSGALALSKFAPIIPPL